MKKNILLFSFCFSAIIGYTQKVITAPKNQPQSVISPTENPVKVTDTKNQPVVSEIDKSIKPPAKLTPLCYGKIAADGSIINGTGNFTVRKMKGYGGYSISCEGVTSSSVVFITGTNYKFQPSYEMFSTSISVFMHLGVSDAAADAEFQFIVYNP